MKIIGLNFGHDSAITYLDGGVIKFAIEEEKTSRVKQGFGWAKTAWDDISERLDVAPADVDVVAIGGLLQRDRRERDSLPVHEE